MQKDPDWQATPIRAFLEPHTYTHFGERTRFGVSPRELAFANHKLRIPDIPDPVNPLFAVFLFLYFDLFA